MTQKICLVGAGNIANSHFEALSAMPNVAISTIVDPNIRAAEALAAKCNGAQAFADLSEALKTRDFDRAHVLVPPPFHENVAMELINEGVSVLCEKPLATDSKACRDLISRAAEKNVVLAVNQNGIFDPAYLKLSDTIQSGAVGKLRHVHCFFNVPLRQLAANQMGHWMFNQPMNILLEQAVHPLSQILDLIGDVTNISAHAPSGNEFSPGTMFFSSCSITLQGTKASAQLHFAVGREYPFWQVSAVCDDGVVVADFVSNRTYTHGRTRLPDFANAFFQGLCLASQISWQSTRNGADYLLSLMRLKSRSDSFYLSMASSIAAFHDALDNNRMPKSSGKFGGDLVEICEQISALAFNQEPAAPKPAVAANTDSKSDVVLLGGTGFIGAHTLRHLLDAGRTVTVMARNLNNLPAVFHADGVTLLRGDVTVEADVSKAVATAPIVVNLAHGGGGDSWEAIERSMVGSARLVGTQCLAAGTTRLIHIGSIAGLYLGDPNETITGQTPPDPQAESRGDYGRGKAMSDNLLLEMHRTSGLPVCILRPGVVVGEGTSPFHSGLGFYNNNQYCLGWNKGQNGLPFILGSDVASAIVASMTADDIDGKSYNLVGDVTLSAREFLSALANVTGRPLQFYPQSVYKLYGTDIGKWLIKRAIGRKVAFPSFRDLKSRGMDAQFDCSDAKAELNWKPVANLNEFLDAAIPSVAHE